MLEQLLHGVPCSPCCSGMQNHQVNSLRGRPSRAGGPLRQQRTHLRQHRHACRAAKDGDKPDPASDSPAAEDKPVQQRRKQKQRGKTVSLKLRRTPEEVSEAAEAFTLDDFNPVAIGKRSRQVFDDVWQQFARLATPGSSSLIPGFDYQSPAEEFSSPAAADTTVLVAGATGRVGRILIRKLLLRGYKVRALVRGRDEGALEAIPQSVTVIRGDVGDYSACAKAMEGVDKVISCMTARSDLSGDLRRVEEEGVKNLARAYMDRANALARRLDNTTPSRLAKVPIVKFNTEEKRTAWRITQCGLPRDGSSGLARRAFDRGQDIANVGQGWGTKGAEEGEVIQHNSLLFSGTIYSRGGRAELSGPVSVPQGQAISGSEGLVLRLGADGNAYTLLLHTGGGHSYSARISTRPGFMTARLPFSLFRAEDSQAPPDVDPAEIAAMTIRFDKPRATMAVVLSAVDSSASNDFRLELDWVKVLPGGVEADMVLVSCVGAHLTGEARRKMVTAKRRGEDVLRASGLGYTVVRPGPLLEEPGGYKALVFDQGGRIAENISCADVADVALKALHDGAARNKTFEVCSEITAEPGGAAYELVAHLPDRSNNYLTPALAGLEKNT